MDVTEKIKHSEELKQLSRQIANSANRLVKLLEMDAPLYFLETERQMLVERIARLPVNDISEFKQRIDEFKQHK